MTQTATTPKKWHEVYRNDEEKCLFVGKDGASGLIRAKDKEGKRYEWRSTDALAKEAGLSKRRTEEILEHYCNRGVVRQHAKDPEKWGYWQVVGTEKSDPDLVKKDHDDRMVKQQVANGKPASAAPAAAAPAGTGTGASGGSPVKTAPKKTTSPTTKTPAKAP